MSEALRPRPLGELVGEARTEGAHGIGRAEVLVLAGQYRRRAPTFVEASALEPAHAGGFARCLGTLQQFHDPVRAVTFADALVAGQGTLVTASGMIVRESAAEFLAHGRVPDGFATASDDGFVLTLPRTRHVAAPCVLVKRPWFRNYGHWLVDGAALLALLSRARLPEGTTLVVGRQPDPAMRDVVGETLALVAPGMPVLEQPDEEAWTFGALIYVTPVHVPPLFKLPEGLTTLRALVLRDRLTTPVPGPRLFVRRPEGATRPLVNEAILIEACRARGFTVVDALPASVLEQARLFHAAECVVGVKGAALANLIFCRPSASVVVLSPGDFPDPFFWDIAGQGVRAYAEVFGPLAAHDRLQSHNPFSIDPAHLDAALDAVL